MNRDRLQAAMFALRPDLFVDVARAAGVPASILKGDSRFVKNATWTYLTGTQGAMDALKAVVIRGHEANKQQAAAEARAAREPKPAAPPPVETPPPPPVDPRAQLINETYRTSISGGSQRPA